MKIRVSDYISNFFVKKNLSHVFGITGGGAMHLNEAFGKNKKLNFIFFHHEQSASMAADAYFRKNNKACVLHTTSGPGATNAITGVTGAWIDSIPMFVISGQVPTSDMIKKTKTRQIGVQEINIIDLVKPITKFAKTLRNPNEIDLYLNEAFNLMHDDKPGPVWLDIPLDIQSKFINTLKIKKFKKNKIKSKHKINFKPFFKKILESSKPIIIVGNGVHISKSEIKFRKFYKKLNIPVISSWNASDLFNHTDKLYVGRMGIFGDRASNFAAENSDLMIILGSRLSIPQTGYKTMNFAKNSRKIIVDICVNELRKKKLSNINLQYKNDLKFFLSEFNKFIKNKKIKKFHKWLRLIHVWKKKYPVMEKKYLKDRGINSFYFIDTLSKSLNGNETIVTDMGTSFTCTMQSLKIQNCNKQRLFTSSGLASMGFGLPGAIGAYFADRKNNIICITGDGGFMFNMQELQTISHYKIPMKIFILENKGYLTMKLMQKKNFNRLVGSNKASGVSFPEFKKIAKSFNFKYFKITKNNMKKQLKEIVELKQPTIIEINMPSNQPLVPRIQNKLLSDGSFVTPKLDDLYPFLNKKVLNHERLIATKIK